MIRSFRHSGLRLLYEAGLRRGIPPSRAERLEELLALLDVAENFADLALPAFRLHQLRGELVTAWSISISGNWGLLLICFEGDIYEVNLVDYH